MISLKWTKRWIISLTIWMATNTSVYAEPLGEYYTPYHSWVERYITNLQPETVSIQELMDFFMTTRAGIVAKRIDIPEIDDLCMITSINRISILIAG